MIRCMLCLQIFNNMSSFSMHLIKSEKIDTKTYYDQFLGSPVYCSCGKKTKFLGLILGYSQHCSRICARHDIKCQKKQQETIFKKYGVKSTFQIQEVKDKFKKNFIKKYGVENPFQLKEVKEKIKSTNLKKYGVENPSQCNQIKENKKQTSLKNYGVEYHLQSEIILEKKRQTSLKNYGVDHHCKSDQYKQSRISELYNRLINSDRLKNMSIVNFQEYDFTGVNQNYSWKCIKCNNVFSDNLDNGHIPICPICYPKEYRSSKGEKELLSFVTTFYDNVLSNQKLLKNNQEIDIYIPEIKLGIEYNGLYWHSELSGKRNMNYHINKLKQCDSFQINLIHIFEDEWMNMQSIVKSILLSKMGKIENKIFARKCTINNVENNIATQFYYDNHIQGSINGIHYGLYYDKELVSILTIGKPRFNKKYEWEIYRFCNKINTNITGGLSKLINCFIKQKDPLNILTYADARFGKGLGYLKCGFNLIDVSKPNYYYMKNYTNRISRLQFQKHLLESKLEIFDSKLTEWENMQLNGYDRIWDCGNYVYEWKKNI